MKTVLCGRFCFLFKMEALEALDFGNFLLGSEVSMTS